MLDNPAKFLIRTWQKSGNIFKSDQGNVERIAESNESRALQRRFDIEASGKMRRLVRDDADGTAIEPRKSNHKILRVKFVNLKKISIVGNGVNDVLDVVGNIRFRRHKRVQRWFRAIRRIACGTLRHILQIVGGKKRQQFTHQQQALLIVVRKKLSDTADTVMRIGAAELLLRHFFVGDGLENIRSGNEHVAGLVHHHDEIRDRGRIDGAAGTRSHDGGDLRDHSGCQRIAKKDIGVTAERKHAFLNSRTAGIVEPDHRRSHLHGEIHDLADFPGIGFAERAAKNREVLSENIDQTAVDAAVSAHDSIAGILLRLHSEIAAAMLDELVDFFEGVLVEQKGDALARRHLAIGLLAIQPFAAAAKFGSTIQLAQMFNAIGSGDAGHYVPLLHGLEGGDFLPILEELFDAAIRQRMFQ